MIEYERRVRPGELFIEYEGSKAVVYLPQGTIKVTLIIGFAVSVMGASVTLAIWRHGFRAQYPVATALCLATYFTVCALAVVCMELWRRRRSVLTVLPKGLQYRQSINGREISSASWMLLWTEVTEIVVHRTRHEIDLHFTTRAGAQMRQLHCWGVPSDDMDRLAALLDAGRHGRPLH